MTQPIDVAYVELKATGEDEAARDIKAALDDVAKSVKLVAQSVEKTLKNAFQDAGKAAAKDLAGGAAVADAAIKKLGNDAQRELNGVEGELKQVTAEFITAAVAARALDSQIKDAESELKRLALEFARTGDQSFAGQIKSTQALIRELSNARKIIKDAGDESVGVFTKIYRSVRDGDSLLGSAFRGIENVGRQIGKVFDEVGDSAKSNFGSIGTTLGSFAGVLATVGSALGNVLTAAPLLTLFVALTPVIVAVGSSLASLLGLVVALPAAIAVLISVVAPLIISFQGLGEAVSALASGDLDKINAAMKNLAPSAQAFARELNALREPLKAIKLAVQESFFAPLRGVLTQVVKTLLPTLESGLGLVAGALGRFLAQFGKMLTLPGVVRTFNAVFKTTAQIIDAVGPSIVNVFTSLASVVQVGLPYLKRFGDAIAGVANRFAAFLTASVDSGGINKFIDGAITAFKSLGTLVVSVTKFLGALFGSTAEEGNNFVVGLARLIDRMTAFLKSAEGQKALHDLVDILRTLIVVANAVFDVISFLNRAFIDTKNAVSGAVDIVSNFFSAIGDGAKSAYGAVAGFFKAVGDFFANVGSVAASAYDAVVGFFSDVVDELVALPGQVVAALEALPGLLVSLFQTTFDAVTYAVGFALGTLIRLFIDFPGQVIAAVSALYDLLVGFFTATFDALVALGQALVATVVYTFTQLPGQVYNAVVSLVKLLFNVFTDAFNTAVRITTNIVNTVVNFFSQLPGRASNAASSLPGKILGILRSIVSGAYNIGKDIIGGIVRGIGDAIGGAIDAAKRAARNILQGAKNAIEGHSPSRLFAREVGVPIAQGVAVGITEGAPTARRSLAQTLESLLPGGTTGTAAPAAAATSATTTSSAGPIISFAQGAVQVIFQGVVPTEAEALRTGQAVGAGVAQSLARQQVRTQVRMT